MNIDPYYLCFPKMCWEKEESPSSETHYSKGQIQDLRKVLAVYMVVFPVFCYGNWSQILSPPHNYQLETMVTFGLEKCGIS